MLIEKDSLWKNNLNFIKGILIICVNFILIVTIFPERLCFHTALCMWIMHGNECTLQYMTMQWYVLICC